MKKLNFQESNIDSYFSGLRNFFKRNKVLTRLFRVLLLLALIVTIAFLGVYVWTYNTVPSRDSFAKLKNYVSSEVYSKDGKVIGKYFLQDRTNIPIEKISPNVINALIATEDVRFYQHNGIDNKGLLRVFFKSLLLGNESSGGGSTITQQLAKNLYPRQRYPFFSMAFNKLREAITAEKLEDVFNKEDILTLYLNTVPFGDNAFGIEVAARRFFNKSADSLTVQEAATLIGMLKATTSYNPRKNPDASKSRRNVVLHQMAKYGYLSAEAKDSIQQLPLLLNYRYLDHNKGIATYFREHLRQELLQWCATHRKEDGTKYNIYTDGLKIYTTIDSRMQDHAEKAVNAHMKKLQKSFYDHWGKSLPWGRNFKVVNDAMKRSAYYQQLVEEGKSKEEIAKIFNTPVESKIFSWNGIKSRKMSPLDSLKYYLQFLHSGFVAMDPHSGEVKAWVGGINHEYFKYDHVNENAKRQVGSTFKPLVYAAALEEGVSPCEYISNDKMVYEAYNNWSPGNSDGVYGGKYSLEGALTNSVNTVSAQLIMKAGIENVVNLARRMGIISPLDPVPSLALGTADISLLEMVGAYSVFPNKGYYTKPKYLVRIEAADGTVLEDFTKEENKHMAISPYNAAVMTKMLESVVNKGTAARLRGQYALTLPIGGKTGTTQSHADGWFIGFTPDLVAGAWVGAEDRRIHFRSIQLGQGANMALPIWGEFMKRVLADPQFSKMKKSSFPELPENALAEMDCEPFLEPVDSTSFWDSLFGVRNDSLRAAQREQKKQEKMMRKYDKRKRKNSGDDLFDGFLDLFKKK